MKILYLQWSTLCNEVNCTSLRRYLSWELVVVLCSKIEVATLMTLLSFKSTFNHDNHLCSLVKHSTFNHKIEIDDKNSMCQLPSYSKTIITNLCLLLLIKAEMFLIV